MTDIVAPGAHPSVVTWFTRLADRLADRLARDPWCGTPLVVRVDRAAVCDPEVVAAHVGGGAVAVGIDAEGRELLAFGPGTARPILEQASTLAEALATLRAAGSPLRFFPVEGAGADPRAPMAKLVLTGKGHALRRLAPQAPPEGGWEIDPPWILARAEWQARRAATQRSVARRWPDLAVIVRSSHASEDGWARSNAGAFLSVVVARGGEEDAVGRAIDRVFAQYRGAQPGDEVFLQGHLSNVSASGVAMTRHPDSGAPYLVVSFDASSGRTDVVTSGHGAFETAYVARTADLLELPSPVREAAAMAADLIRLLGEDGLDLELALSPEPQLLQVRPIARGGWAPELAEQDARVAAIVGEARQAYRARQAARGPGVVGTRPVYSSMTDWNPAEMIGRRPTALARSLYEHLITDRGWAAARAGVGYRDLRGTPLMVAFAGHAFIDVRASLGSFVPAAISDDVAAALVDAQLDKLRASPYLDDKVEFEVAETCARRGSVERLSALGLGAARAAAVNDALREVTLTALAGVDADVAALGRPTALRAAVPPQRELGAALEAAVAGAERFARLARCAFITTALLRDLVEAGALRASRAEHLLRTVRSVTFEMRACGSQVAAGERPFKALVQLFGHLRPGTYDLRVPRYDADPLRYLLPFASEPFAGEREPDFEPTLAEEAELARALASFGVPLAGRGFLTLLGQAVRGREEGKLVFTRPLGDALELIAGWGERCELSREQLAQLSLDAVRELMGRPVEEARSRGTHLAEVARQRLEAVCRVELPEVLVREADFDWHLAHRTRPSFITRRQVRAPAVAIDPDSAPCLDEVAGRVVLVEHADPGFDWLFSTRIAGLVTAYGGANSHIGVRCAELDVPAAIGVGQETFRRMLRTREVLLDCEGGRLVELG
jgi:glutamine kinase